MNWIILLFAGLFEVSLTFCLGKARAASGIWFYLWGSGFLASTILSMALLAKAVQTLPLGTAYAIWTGIGAVGTVLIGIFVFKEPATPIRLFFLFTLIASLIGFEDCVILKKERRKMKYELRENQGIPAPLLALLAVATGLSVANCYYNQPLLGSMAKEFAVSDFSASMVATLTQIGYVVGLVFVIPLGDLDSRKKLIQTNYLISLCALLAIALAPNIYWVWGVSLVAGASSVMPQFFIPLVSYHSTPSRKVRNVGIIQSCLLVGILGSRVFSGLLADEWGWRSVYLVASVFMLGCFLLIHGMLPELTAVRGKTMQG